MQMHMCTHTHSGLYQGACVWKQIFCYSKVLFLISYLAYRFNKKQNISKSCNWSKGYLPRVLNHLILSSPLCTEHTQALACLTLWLKSCHADWLLHGWGQTLALERQNLFSVLTAKQPRGKHPKRIPFLGQVSLNSAHTMFRVLMTTLEAMPNSGACESPTFAITDRKQSLRFQNRTAGKATFPFSHKTNTVLILRLIWSQSE